VSKCDLRIVLDREDGCYEIGELVRGVVQVQVNEPCKCKKLTLTQRWKTHGRGNRTAGPKDEDVLFAGTFEPGQHEYPFEFPAPAGPLSYHGHYLNVDWYLTARADIPWAIDPKAETELLVIRGDYDGAVDFGLGPDSPPEKLATGKASGGLIAVGCFGLVFALMGTAALVTMLMAPAGSRPPLPVMIIPCVFIAVGLGIMFFGIRNVLAERKLGGVDVTLSNYHPAAGEAVTCTLTFRPKTTVKLNAISACLKGEEVVVRGSGSNRSTYRHGIFEQRETMIERKQASVGRAITLETTFVLPEDAPPTFRASDNSLVWQVSVAIDIPGWPDWSKDYAIFVS
jgi:hypothetical protein